jgi:hypothetical protein
MSIVLQIGRHGENELRERAALAVGHDASA